MNNSEFHNFYLLCCFVLCIFIIAQIPDLSSVFLIFFCGALGKHHSQKHETQNTNTQTTGAQDVSSDVIVILAVVHRALVCVVDIPADAIANVAKFSLNLFHGLFPLSFICLYCIMDFGICQLSDCTNKCRKKLAELCILPKPGGHAGATKINGKAIAFPLIQ
jgi:hypothetical protein